MLAYTVKDLDKVSYPVYVSPKLDGIRAIVLDGVVYSRTMKPIRSKAVQELFGHSKYNGFDGELIYGNPTASDVFNKSTSFCMSKEIPDGMDKGGIWFYVFDVVIEYPYSARSLRLIEQLSQTSSSQVAAIHSWLCYDAQDVKEHEEHYLNLGYEGV